MSISKKIGLALSATKSLTKAAYTLGYGIAKFEVLSAPVAVKAMVIGVSSSDIRKVPEILPTASFERTMNHVIDALDAIHELNGTTASDSTVSIFVGLQQSFAQNRRMWNRIADLMDEKGIALTPSSLQMMANQSGMTTQIWAAMPELMTIALDS